MTPRQRHHRVQSPPSKKKMNILQAFRMPKGRKRHTVNLFLILEDIVSSHLRKGPNLSLRCRPMTQIGAKTQLNWKRLQVSLAFMHTFFWIVNQCFYSNRGRLCDEPKDNSNWDTFLWLPFLLDCESSLLSSVWLFRGKCLVGNFLLY